MSHIGKFVKASSALLLSCAFSDCAVANIGVDAGFLYPQGFHPGAENWLPDYSTLAPYKCRYKVDLRYYYLDFGISSYFSPGSDKSRLVLGIDGHERQVPELSYDVPYDPFKVDVFILGCLLEEELHLVRHGYLNSQVCSNLCQTALLQCRVLAAAH